MVDDVYAFDRDAAKRVVDAVRLVENATLDIGAPNDDNDQLFQVQGKLNGALSAGTSFAQNPPTAELQVYVPDPDSANNNQLIDAGYTVTLTNRDPNITKAQNDWCRAVFLNGEWQPHGGGGGGSFATTAEVFKVTSTGGASSKAVVIGTTYTINIGGQTAGSSVTLVQDATNVAAIHFRESYIAAGQYFLIYDIGGPLPVLDQRAAFLEVL